MIWMKPSPGERLILVLLLSEMNPLSITKLYQILQCAVVHTYGCLALQRHLLMISVYCRMQNLPISDYVENEEINYTITER